MNKNDDEVKKLILETLEVIDELEKIRNVSPIDTKAVKRLSAKLLELEKRKLLISFDFMFKNKYGINVSDFSDAETTFNFSINDMRDIIFTSYGYAMENAVSLMAATPPDLTGAEVVAGAYTMFSERLTGALDLIDLNKENAFSLLPAELKSGTLN